MSGLWNIGYASNCQLLGLHWTYSKYNVHPLNNFQDIRQNQRIVKYRSPWSLVNTELINQIIFIHEIDFQIFI